MTFYERIEELRKEKGLSQAKLEKELGFSNGSFSKWKNSMPTHERLQKLADFFNVSTEYLTTGEEQGTYYQDETVRELAEFLRRNPEHKVLFDASRKVGKQDINKALKAIEIFIDE